MGKSRNQRSPSPASAAGLTAWHIEVHDFGLQKVVTDGVDATGPGSVTTEQYMTRFFATAFVLQRDGQFRHKDLRPIEAVSCVDRSFTSQERHDADARVIGQALLNAVYAARRRDE